MIPHGESHDLLARPDLPAPPLETVIRDVGYSGSGPLIVKLEDAGEPVRLLCGHFAFSPTARRNSFLRNLPASILARDLPGAAADWVVSTITLLSQETGQLEHGHRLIVHRMTEVLFVQALRLWMRQGDLPSGILRGLGDPQLSRAISAIHAQPEKPWTVETLAREAGLSRSVFAQRFSTLIGTSPLRYLTELRMQIAHRLLRFEGQSVDAVARAVGYQSGPAFARVFSKHFSKGPGQVRRSEMTAAPDQDDPSFLSD